MPRSHVDPPLESYTGEAGRQSPRLSISAHRGSPLLALFLDLPLNVGIPPDSDGKPPCFWFYMISLTLTSESQP